MHEQSSAIRFIWKVAGTQGARGTIIRDHEETGEVEAESMGEAFARVVSGIGTKNLRESMEWGTIDEGCAVTIALEPVTQREGNGG